MAKKCRFLTGKNRFHYLDYLVFGNYGVNDIRLLQMTDCDLVTEALMMICSRHHLHQHFACEICAENTWN